MRWLLSFFSCLSGQKIAVMLQESCGSNNTRSRVFGDLTPHSDLSKQAQSSSSDRYGAMFSETGAWKDSPRGCCLCSSWKQIALTMQYLLVNILSIRKCSTRKLWYKKKAEFAEVLDDRTTRFLFHDFLHRILGLYKFMLGIYLESPQSPPKLLLSSF